MQKAKAAPDPLVKKRNQDNNDGSDSKRLKTEQIPQIERLKNSTIPYWNVPYDEQVKKNNFM